MIFKSENTPIFTHTIWVKYRALDEKDKKTQKLNQPVVYWVQKSTTWLEECV